MSATSRSETGLLGHVFECSEHSFLGSCIHGFKFFKGCFGLISGERFFSIGLGCLTQEIAKRFSILFSNDLSIDSAFKSEPSLFFIDISALVCVDQVEDFRI